MILDTSVNFYQTTQHHNPESYTLHSHCHNNHKSHISYLCLDSYLYVCLELYWMALDILENARTFEVCDRVVMLRN